MTMPSVGCHLTWCCFQFSCSVMSDSLQPQGLQHSRPPCPSPTPGIYSNSCSLSQWCHPAISSSVIPFSSYLQSFPASGSFPMSQFFASGSHSIGVSTSASVLPVNIQDWFPLGWTCWIPLLCYNDHILRLKILPPWTCLVPISLHYVLGLCHSFKSCAHTMKCCSVITRDDVLIHVTVWMNLNILC